MTDFSPLEIQYVKSSLGNKTDGELAAFLERDIDEVHAFIDSITGGGAMSRSLELAREREAAQLQVKEKADKKERARQERILRATRQKENKSIRDQQRAEKDKNKRIAAENQWAYQRKQNEARQRRFQTIEVNLQGMISVRVDRKTYVFVKPGADIEAIKKRYQRSLGKEVIN